jgi:hypothetical protein
MTLLGPLRSVGVEEAQQRVARGALRSFSRSVASPSAFKTCSSLHSKRVYAPLNQCTPGNEKVDFRWTQIVSIDSSRILG